MKIGNILASNLLGISQLPTHLMAAMSTFSEAQNAMTDTELAVQLVSPQLFMAGEYGSMEHLCYTILADKIKAKTTDPTQKIYGASVTIADVFEYITKNMGTEFNALLLHQAKLRMAYYQWNVSAEKFAVQSDVKLNVIQTWEFLNRAAVIMTKRGTKTVRSLITRNLDLIGQLNKYNMIAWKEKQTIMDIQKKLVDQKDCDSLLKDGKAFVVRLDYQRTIVGPNGARQPIFTVTVPTGRIPLSETAEFSYSPVSAAYAEDVVLKELFKSGVFNVTKISDYGDKTRKITTNPQVVLACYNDCEPDAVSQKISMLYPAQPFGPKLFTTKQVTGFDVLTLRHVFVDVESSISGAMTWSMQPGAFKEATVAAPSTISQKYHKIDMLLLVQVRNSRILNARVGDFDCLPAEIGLGAEKFGKAKRQKLIEYCEALDNYELYDFMTNPAHAKLFGNVTEQLENRGRIRRTYLKNFKPVKIEGMNPDSLEKLINDALIKGVVHLTIVSKSHGVRQVLATNNNDILEKEYGSDYIIKYGSPRARLKALDTLISGGTTVTADMLAEYDLSEKLSENFVSMSKTDQLADIKNAILVLAEKDTTIKPYTLMFKVADSFAITRRDGSISIYDQCNLSNIIEVAVQ